MSHSRGCPTTGYITLNLLFTFQGTRAGDPEECRALDRIFCTNRKEPMLIGSVKSNIGHTEASSGICSITKVVLSFEQGAIPPNLHFEIPRQEIAALVEGRMKVCTEITPLPGSLAAVNSFGFGGANGNVWRTCYTDSKLINFKLILTHIFTNISVFSKYLVEF